MRPRGGRRRSHGWMQHPAHAVAVPCIHCPLILLLPLTNEKDPTMRRAAALPPSLNVQLRRMGW